MPTVVFDFDKTLTKRDTVIGFLLAASDKSLIPFRRVIFLFFAVLHKLKLISNDRLKKLGIGLFLKGLSQERVKERATKYAAAVLLSSIYDTEFASKYPQAIIATASYEDYVRPLCRNNLILAAKLDYTNGKVSGLLQNAWAEQKVSLLKENGITRVDVFYTDSFSDQAVMDISTVVYLVKKNNIKKIKG